MAYDPVLQRRLHNWGVSLDYSVALAGGPGSEFIDDLDTSVAAQLDVLEARMDAIYSIMPAPDVVSISPTVGTPVGGDTITVTGTGFVGATDVTVAGSSVEYEVVSNTSITFVSPAHAVGAVAVAVTSLAGSDSLAAALTYTVPAVTSATPNSGVAAGGTAITLLGARFAGATAVTVGGVACTSVIVVDDLHITCVTGAHAAGLVNVVVTAPAGVGTGTGAYTYT